MFVIISVMLRKLCFPIVELSVIEWCSYANMLIPLPIYWWENPDTRVIQCYSQYSPQQAMETFPADFVNFHSSVILHSHCHFLLLILIILILFYKKLVNIYCHEIVDAPQLGGLPAHDDIILILRFKSRCPQIFNFKR